MANPPYSARGIIVPPGLRRNLKAAGYTVKPIGDLDPVSELSWLRESYGALDASFHAKKHKMISDVVRIGMELSGNRKLW